MRAPVPVSNLASFSLLRKPPPSFRTEQDDFFFPFHSCERIGLRREESLFLFCSGELVSPSYSLASRHSPLLPVSSRAERGICFSLPRPTWREGSWLALSPAAIDETPTQPKLDRLPFRPLRAAHTPVLRVGLLTFAHISTILSNRTPPPNPPNRATCIRLCPATHIHSNGTNKVIDRSGIFCYALSCTLTLSPEASYQILARFSLSPLSPPFVHCFLTILYSLLSHLESTLTKV